MPPGGQSPQEILEVVAVARDGLKSWRFQTHFQIQAAVFRSPSGGWPGARTRMDNGRRMMQDVLARAQAPSATGSRLCWDRDLMVVLAALQPLNLVAWLLEQVEAQAWAYLRRTLGLQARGDRPVLRAAAGVSEEAWWWAAITTPMPTSGAVF